MTESTAAPKKRVARPKTIFQLADGTPVNYKGINKFFRDVVRFHNGAEKAEKAEIVIVENANSPLGGKILQPDKTSPVCAACKLDETGCHSPYMEYMGSETPVATILVESISKKEDERGSIGAGGINSWLAAIVHKLQEEHGVSLDEIRWVPITRCASRAEKLPNFKTKGNWCRHHAIQDLMLHPPKVVIPVGTSVLGLLSHKSNAGDWSGRLLTWRGWPDEWLMEPDFVLDRPDPLDDTKLIRGHPLHGPVPNTRIPMVPLQNPKIILGLQNELVFERWVKDLVFALKTGKCAPETLNYDREWYKISTDWEEVIQVLKHAIRLAETYENFIVAYDTETTGLKPWAHFKRVKAAHPMDDIMSGRSAAIKADEQLEDQIIRSAGHKIVFMMFRWENPETGKPESIGFPWDYDTSEIRKHMDEISPLVITLLSLAATTGHNLTFDELFTIVTVGRKENEYEPFNSDGSWNESWLMLQERINLLAQAARYDTWHMAFTAIQKRGSLGLEILAYNWVPDLAGYEEEMTILISLYGDLMNPANNKGGHYANCPRHLWQSHLRPYVMGDVEVTYQAREGLAAKLKKTKIYKIPLARPDNPGCFRYYVCPNREWIYENIVSPAARALTKMMARGMYIDPEELTLQERSYPEKVNEAKKRLREADPAIEDWCRKKTEESETAQSDGSSGNKALWELDLENKKQLKELLFDVLKCNIQRFTKNGRKLYGDDPADWQHLSYEEQKQYAAVDKYTLNRLAVDHPNLRPLQDYRKVFKLYSTYVRPMRNMMADHLDKKQRVKEPHLSVDHCVHAQFMLTGTRSGRLCVAGDTKLDVEVDGRRERVEINRLWMYKGHHVTIKTHQNRQKEIVRLYFKGREPMFLVVTQGGSKIKATGGHRILTRRGWIAVRDLTQSDEIRVDRAQTARNVTEPEIIHAVGSGGKTGFLSDQPVDFATCSPTELAGLSRTERSINGTAPCSPRQYENRQQERTTRPVSHDTRKQARGYDFTGDTRRKDGSGDWHHSVFSQTEHAGIWVAEIGQRTGQGPRVDGAPNSRDRSKLSRPNESVLPILEGQSDLFQKSLSGLFNSVGSGLVFERHVPTSISSTQRTFWWDGGDFLVNEQTRTGFVTGAYFPEDSALQRVCLQRESESRFRFDRHKHLDRNRRRIPYARTDRGIYVNSRSPGLQSPSIFDTPDSVQDGNCNFRDTDSFEPIFCRCPIGEQEVWDIEVKDDHSYLAQGIYHHNSSRDPNLQQLPNEGLVKRLFASRFKDRGCIYAADLSQIELRLMAAACGDESMVKAYMEDIDIHSLTASKIFKVPYETFTKQHMEMLQKQGKNDKAKDLELKRKIAKTTNFLTGYGGGAFGLQNVLANNEVYMSIEECEDIVTGFFEAYPVLKRFLGIYKSFIEENGVAVSMFGRVRQFEEIYGEDQEAAAKALRAGCNHLIQSTASDMMLICLFTIEALMRDAKLNSLLVSTVHDNLVIDAVREELPEVHAIIHGVMNNIPSVLEANLPGYDTSWMTVPFAGDSEVGLNYLETNKISGDSPDWDKLLQPKKKG